MIFIKNVTHLFDEKNEFIVGDLVKISTEDYEYRGSIICISPNEVGIKETGSDECVGIPLYTIKKISKI